VEGALAWTSVSDEPEIDEVEVFSGLRFTMGSSAICRVMAFVPEAMCRVGAQVIGTHHYGMVIILLIRTVFSIPQRSMTIKIQRKGAVRRGSVQHTISYYTDERDTCYLQGRTHDASPLA